MTDGQTGPVSSQITAMQSLLTANRLNVSPTAEGVLTVELRNGAQVTVATADGDGPRWAARAGETVIYDSPEAGIPADTDAAWAAEAVARYAAEAERGTDLTNWFGGNLGQVLERAFQAHGITAVHDGNSVTNVTIELPDETSIQMWDGAHENAARPAAEYLRFDAVHVQLADGWDAPETEIPLTYTGSLWGDLAVLIHAVKALYDAAQ
ncbi:hypothetical protein [Streptomyces sp. S1D4-20]|uniref:hypothetical protein n=1 Tax=Streptomyces sp. S1D4-20 TaxID=2594462 RepID=UPI00116499BE|nr:hypothetical protein [Streptomyces sp. S1D4-20]QDN54290.1 hypothetical protein FNV67_01645 [Streptomyces sp. S1D4-20]